MSAQELCYECDAPTGRAGAAEDSLYHGDLGPFCEDCFDRLPEEWHDEAVGLRRQRDMAREALRKVPRAINASHTQAEAELLEKHDTAEELAKVVREVENEVLRALAVLDGEDKADG